MPYLDSLSFNLNCLNLVATPRLVVCSCYQFQTLLGWTFLRIVILKMCLFNKSFILSKMVLHLKISPSRMAYFFTEAGSILVHSVILKPRFCIMSTAVLQLDTQGSKSPIKGLKRTSFGKVLNLTSRNLLRTVMYVRESNLRLLLQLVYCSHYPFLLHLRLM